MTIAKHDPDRSMVLGLSHPVRYARFSVALLTSTALAVTPVLAADDLPTGAQVVSGSVSIGTSGSTLTVTQGSDKAIVNWNSFSIGAGNTVNFVQPGSSSAVLNRVTGGTTSTIAGSITANGQVYLINPNGILITSTGAVKVGGGFVASTLDISNDDFLSGQYNFTGHGASAGVSNEGVVSVGRGGYAALIGGTVKNDGLIAVPVGKVGLGSGEQATLDLSGDGFLQVAVPTKNGAEGTGALIENSGTISAEGGTVVMQAATARDAARHAINLSGVVEANSVSGSDGAIVIGGGEGGAVTVSGKIKATSSTGKGGKVTVTGKSVSLKGATVDASGKTGGGTVKIGGDWQGSGTTQRAETVSVDAASVIRADATESGNGGKVIVWSDDLSTFAGTITARGAGVSGIGGDAEVSGKATLAYTGFTDLTGTGGFGNLLLDPYNITISSGTASNSTGTTATGNDSIINVGTLTNALSAANVTITTGASGSAGSQAGNITVADAVSWTSGSTLTLSAYGSITLNANLTGGTGSSIVLRADNSGTGTGTVTFGTGITATASGGVSLYYNPTGNVSSTVNSTSYKTATNYTTNAGSGTTITAYMLVNTVYDLQNVQNNLSGTYALGRDIDASGTASWNSGAGFNPIGNGSTNFTGTFDGLSHTITGLTINRTTGYVGLVGYNTGTIRNVGMLGGSIKGGADFVGGLVGFNLGAITNAYTTGTVSGTISVGGLVGYDDGGTITNAYATGAVSGGDFWVGGLVGANNGTINNSYATGAVSASSEVGGLVGVNSGTIYNSYATGAVSGTSSVGGLVGVTDGTVRQSYATGSVTGSGNYVGGLVGTNEGTVSASFWDIATSSRTTGIGGGTNSGAIGLTTAQMNNPFTFIDAGWNFTTVWAVVNTGTGSTPVLRSLTSADVYNYYVRLSGNSTGTYGGTITSGITLYGVGAGNVTVNFGSGVVNAGTYSYSDTGVLALTYSTGTASDYYIAYGTGTLTVNKASLLLNGISALGKTYDGTTVATLTGSAYVSALNNDVVYLTGTGSGSFTDKNVGTGKAVNVTGYTLSGADAGNYTLVVPTSLTADISRLALTVSANNATKTYGDANPSLTYTITGGSLLGNDTLTGSLSTTADQSSSVGTYAISQGTLANSNYAITYAAGTLSISQRAITITADAATKSYGDANSNLTYTITSGSLVSSDALTGALTTTADQSSSVGTYTISQGTLAASTNYAVTYAAGTLTVTPASLTVTANAATKTYGDANPTLTYSTSGLLNNDRLTGVLATTATQYSDVGTYAITQGTLANSNYTITYVGDVLTVTPASLTVTANAATKTYDGIAYSGGNGVSYSGFVNDEDASVLGGTLAYGGTAQGAASVGTYTITAYGLTSGNYAISYVDGGLTVSPAPAKTVTPQPNVTFQMGTQVTLVPVSLPQGVQYASNVTAGDGGMTTENPQFSGAVCFLGPNFAISCSGN